MQGPHEPVDHDPAAVGIRFRRAVLILAVGGLVAVPSGRTGQLAVLPSPFLPVRATPPLPGSAAARETRFPGSLGSRQTVYVSVDSSGRAVSVVDVDRIAITQKGDYSFVIAAPVEDVSAAPGSDSEPGLRTGAVVWQGFSPGRRVLTAAIRLRVEAAAPSLPLRVEGSESELRLINTTSARATSVDASLPAIGLARILDAALAGVKTGRETPAPAVMTRGPIRDIPTVARVPLRVSGTVRFVGGPLQRVEAVVGRRPLRIRGAGALEALELSVAVPDPVSVLRPPGARRWADLAGIGRILRGREGTRSAVARLLAAALALQFHEFLANPDVTGVTRTSYRYELAQEIHRAAPERNGGGGWLLPVGIALALIVAAAGALVLWAHS